MDFQLLATWVKYHRDSIADVDHINVEILASHPHSKEIYITLKVSNALTPVSQQEARHRLDL